MSSLPHRDRRRQKMKFRRSHRPNTARSHRRSLRFESLEGRLVLASVLGGSADTAIVGTICSDLNANGVRDGGEDGLADWTVYLDLNNSGTLDNDADGTPEPSTATNSDGDYRIFGLLPGVYRISEVVQTSWSPTAPVSQDVLVVDGKDTKADFFNFGGGDIVGTIWNDLNDDGVRDTDPVTGALIEPGLADWTVFLDLNTDQTLNPSEPTTLTDAIGEYSFTGLPAGDYEVFEVLPAGWEAARGFDDKQTATVIALEQTTLDFANFNTGA